MAFCPLDYRYGCQDFKHIWSELGRHERQLEVERALIWAHWQLGRVTEEDYNAVAAIANPNDVTKERVSEIEAETRHDIMALTKAMAEAAGEAVLTLPNNTGTLIGTGDSGTLPLAAIDIDGGTDIGADLTTSDLIVVDDGAGGTNRKAALSRVVTLMTNQGFTTDDPTALAIALG